MTWLADSLHCVVFPAAGAASSIDLLKTWNTMFDTGPQSFQLNTLGAPGASHAAGAVNGFQASLSSQPNRLELALSPAHNSGDRPAFISDVRGGMEELARCALILIPQLPLIRISFIGNFAEPAASMSHAAERFAELTGISDIPGTATDLAFALNERKPSVHSPDLPINRIAKYGTIIQQMVSLQVGPGGISPISVRDEQPVTSLQLDINTVPQQAPVPAELLCKVYGELVLEAESILEHGLKALGVGK